MYIALDLSSKFNVENKASATDIKPLDGGGHARKGSASFLHNLFQGQELFEARQRVPRDRRRRERQLHLHTSAYVSIRQACVGIRGHT